MKMRLIQVDAFTDTPFRGNPAAVCVLTEERDAAWMQNVAGEMNLSETAFLRMNAEAISLRWFTPTVEVKFCGHATLASAHVLWEEKLADPGARLRFETLSGTLTAARTGDWIELDFPAKRETRAEAPASVVRALGVTPRYCGRNEFDFLLELDSEEEVRQLRPDFALLSQAGVRGVIVTAPSDLPQFDFVSRFFAPGSGIDEDPVTGSAHCALAPFWQERLGRSEMVGHQISARGGVVRVRIEGERVMLGGQAVTVLRGTLAV